MTHLHTEGIVLDIIKGTSKLNSLFEVNIKRILSPIVELSHVDLIHFSANNRNFLSLNEHRLLIHNDVAVDVDVIEDEVRNPYLFVEGGGERILFVVFFQILELKVLVKPLNMDHKMNIKCSLYVIDIKYFQDNKGNIESQQLLLSELELSWWVVCDVSVFSEVEKVAVLLFSFILAVRKIVADQL